MPRHVLPSLAVLALGLLGAISPLTAQPEAPTTPQEVPTTPQSEASPEPEAPPTAPSEPITPPVEVSRSEAAPPTVTSTSEPASTAPLPPSPAPLAPMAPQAQAFPAEPVARSESPERALSSAGARIELSLLALPLGAGAGNILCGIAECESARGWAAANLFGAGGAAALAALTTRKKPLRFSMAQAIEGGAIWGAATSVYFTVLGSAGYADKNTYLTGLLVGELVGATAGALIEREFRPTSGAVALANSGALWLPSITTLLASTSGLWTDAGVRALGGSLLAAEALGLGLGGLLGQRGGVTRGQVFLSDAGAIVGGGMLPMLAWLIGGPLTPEVGFTTGAAGIALGFTTAYLLATRTPRARSAAARLDKPKRASLSIAPTAGGGMMMLGGRL